MADVCNAFHAEMAEKRRIIRQLRIKKHGLLLRKAACHLNLRVSFFILCLFVIVFVALQLTLWRSNWMLHIFILYSNDDQFQEKPDIHHRNLGHTGGEVTMHNHHPNHEHNHTDTDSKLTVAIGCAITSNNLGNISEDNVPYKFPFLRSFLPSFCRTASRPYVYHLYLSYDKQDMFFSTAPTFNAFHRSFINIRNEQCPEWLNVALHYIECDHTGKPAWAQNDAMMEAYIDNMAYYYRVNDDTNLLTPGWTEAYVSGLAQYDPPNIGVVGPRHIGGHAGILTYDFVHRTHIDIFGLYYPRAFTDWWADNWITSVYGPRRSDRLANVRIHHTLEKGTRYSVQVRKVNHLEEEVEKGKLVVQRYLQSMATLKVQHRKADGKRVISMSLWGNHPRYTFGAIRNAQLIKTVFPEWTLRIYIEQVNANGTTTHGSVPDRILRKLRAQRVQLVRVNTSDIRVPPMMWRFLVADDISLDYFIVRDADGRLTERDAMAVNAWIQTDAPLYCIRDHPIHSTHSLLGGLWGGRPAELQKIMWAPWKGLMSGYRHEYALDMYFLSNTIWTKLKAHAYCHDSVSCADWPNAHPFPVARHGTEHVGQVFDALGAPNKLDVNILKNTPPEPECTSTVHNVINVTYVTKNNIIRP